jgi:hypothetical protein
MADQTDESKETKTTTDAKASDAGSDKGDAKGTGTASDDKSKKVTDPEDVTGLKNTVKALRKERDDLAKAARDAELAKLPELERYKAEAEEFAKENEKLKIENMRMKIGMELGLKWSFAKRITGDTEEEMRSDAADLLKHIKSDEDSDSSKSKDRDAANKRTTSNDGGKGGSAGKPNMSALFRAAAGRTAR